ncbi:MAG: hypothetical protein ACREQP_06795 [Candidatus Binatia bacterium]
MSDALHTESRSDAGYEKRDLEPRTIALFAAGGAVVILFAAALAFWMVQGAARRQSPRPPPAQAREAAPAPRLQVRGSNELRALREAEDALLNSYGWIDKENGIVRIPVERAMEIMAEKEGVRREATGASQKSKNKK